jgi:hypothetical protein
MKKILLIIAFVIFSILALLERLTPFYINNALLHYTVLFVAISAAVLLVADLFFKRKSATFTIIALSVVAIICFGKYFISWRGIWKTQTILYESTSDPNTSIDFQLRADKVSFGYKERIVKRQRITPFGDWTTDTDTDTLKLDPAKWRKVDVQVNEMHLKDWK